MTRSCAKRAWPSLGSLHRDDGPRIAQSAKRRSGLAAFLLKKRLAENNSNVEGLFERIDRGVVRCDNVISELLDYSRTGSAQNTGN